MGYIDPNALGIISQIGYMIVFVATTSLLFFFRPIKRFFRRITGKPEVDTPPPASTTDTAAQSEQVNVR